MSPRVRAAIHDGILLWHVEYPGTWVDGESMGVAAFRHGNTAHPAKWRNPTQSPMRLPLIPERHAQSQPTEAGLLKMRSFPSLSHSVLGGNASSTNKYPADYRIPLFPGKGPETVSGPGMSNRGWRHRRVN